MCRSARARRTTATLVVFVLSLGCGKDQKKVTPPPGDTTAPRTVTDLRVQEVTQTSAVLLWTAPGDDGIEGGAAAQYNVRYATTPLNEQTWQTAMLVPSLHVPNLPGQIDADTISSLSPATTYYIAVKAADEVPNWSGLSNVASTTTLAAADIIAPSAVTDLLAVNQTPSSLDLVWTAPGDDNTAGLATQYDIRYLTEPLTPVNWNAAMPVAGTPIPKIAGTRELLHIGDLTSTESYYFALRTADEVPNWSEFSIVASRIELVPPGQVTDLRAGPVTDSSIVILWTAPGDDDRNSGTAASYDIRYSTSPVTSDSWSSATMVSSPPVPQIAGSAERDTITALRSGTTYQIALKAADEMLNSSSMSNVLTATTTYVPPPPPPPDVTPPAPVNDLSIAGVSITSLTLAWTASGDNGVSGTASQYDIRYAPFPIDNSNWDMASRAPEGLQPAPTGTRENHQVRGCLERNSPYWVALKVADEVPNWSGLSNVAHAPSNTPNYHCALSLVMLVMGEVDISGNLCVAGSIHLNPPNNPSDTAHTTCTTDITTGFTITPPPIFTDPDRFPEATYYYVKGNKIGAMWQAKIFDRNGVDITAGHTMIVAPNDALTYNLGTKTFTYNFDSAGKIAYYFDETTGVFKKNAGDTSVVVNFGEEPIVNPPGVLGVSSLVFDAASSTIRATVINTRYVGPLSPDSLRAVAGNWRGGMLEVKQSIFEPRNGIAMIAYNLEKQGASYVGVGTAGFPTLVFTTNDVVGVNSNFDFVGSFICLGDFHSTGGPHFTYDSGYLNRLPDYLNPLIPLPGPSIIDKARAQPRWR